MASGGITSTQHKTLLTTAVGLALTSSTLLAHADDNSLQLPVVSIEGNQVEEGYKVEKAASPKYTQPLLDTGKTITVIPEEVIKEQGATTLRDVLRNVTGISIQAGEGGTPAGDNMSIRGFNARTDIYVDGVRDLGTYTRDSFNLEQVEVAKGPSSSMSGRGSTGGSINLVSKAPRLDSFTTASVGLGTDEYKRATIDTNQTIGSNSAIRLNVMGYDADTAGRNEVYNSRWGVAPSVAFGLETDTRVTVSYQHIQEDNMPDYGIPWVPTTNTALADYADKAPPVNFDNFYGLVERDYEDIVSDSLKVAAEHDFNDNVTLRNQFTYTRSDRDSIISTPRFNADGSTDIKRELKGRDQVDSIFDNQTDLTLHFATGQVKHDLVTGIQLTREKEETITRNVSSSSALTDLYNPNPYDSYSAVPERTPANVGVTNTQSLYVNDTLHLNPQWQLNGGLRLDHSDTDYTVKTASRTVPLGSYSNNETTLSYQAGVNYKPRENGSLYLSYGNSFNPSAEGLALSDATKDLEPEKNRSYELGTKWELLDSKLLLSAAVFRTEKTNARETDPDDSTLYVMNGKQRVQGLELGAVGQITPQWQVIASYTYMKSKVVSSADEDIVGHELSNTPRNSFSLWSDYDVGYGIKVGAGAQYVDDRYNSTANLRIAPSYTLYDATVSYAVNPDVTLRLNLHNITDEDYIDSVGGGHFVPGTGRYATLTADVSF